MLEEPKGAVEKKTHYGKEYWWCKKHHTVKVQWFHHKPEDHRKHISTSLSGEGGTNPPSKGYSNKKLTLVKDFKDILLSVKYKNDIQVFLYQLNINDQGN